MIPVSAIPEFQNRTLASKDMADNADIRRQIIQAVPEANRQCRELAKYFGRNSQRETCKAIFDYLKNELTYRADGEVQVIKLPAALLRTKVGDCKSYSILTSGVLTNLGIPHHFVMASYNADPTPSHIYVVCDDGTIIDAVWGTFDSEKTPTYKYEVKPNGTMKVKTMTGVGGCGCGCGTCGNAAIGGVGKLFGGKNKNKPPKDKDKPKGLKKVAFAPGRNLFLVIIRCNFDGIATSLAAMDQNKLAGFWKKVGGKVSALQKAIAKGKGKKARKLGLLGMIKRKAGINGISGKAGKAAKTALEAAIAAASTAAGAAVDAGTAGATAGVGTASGVSLGAVLIAMIPLVEELLKRAPAAMDAENVETITAGSIDGTSTPDEADNADDSSATATPSTGGNNTMLIGGVVVAAAVLYFMNKKK